jgi:hypothetical protein
MTQQVNSQQSIQSQSRQQPQQEARQAETGAAERFSAAVQNPVDPKGKKGGPGAKGKKEEHMDSPTTGRKAENFNASGDVSLFSLLARREGRGQDGDKSEGKPLGSEGAALLEAAKAAQKAAPGGKGKTPGDAERETGETAKFKAVEIPLADAQKAATGGKGKAPGDAEREVGGGGVGEDTLPRGEAILAGLAGGVKEQQAPAPISGSDSLPRIDSELTSKLVDRILVSAADSKGNAEVRILLREDILPGTEIRIQRQPDGSVAVQFVTNDVRAEQMLGQRQLTDLQSVLVQNLQVEVQVTATRPDGSMSADAGTAQQQQEQQGQSGGQGQPQDGRSRQHDLYEGLRDET